MNTSLNSTPATSMPNQSNFVPPTNSAPPTNTAPHKIKKSPIRLILAGILLLIVLVGGVAAAYLSNQNQELRQQAAGNKCDVYADPKTKQCPAGCNGPDLVGGLYKCSYPAPTQAPTPPPVKGCLFKGSEYSHDQKFCDSNAVWVCNMGNVSTIQKCGDQETCESGACKPIFKPANCGEHASGTKFCQDNAVFYCNNGNTTKELVCNASTQTCESGACKPIQQPPVDDVKKCESQGAAYSCQTKCSADTVLQNSLTCSNGGQCCLKKVETPPPDLSCKTSDGVVHANGEAFCQGNIASACSNGTLKTAKCDIATQTCLKGTCVPIKTTGQCTASGGKTYEDGEKYCQDNVAMACSNGTLKGVKCATNETCLKGVCNLTVTPPGTRSCYTNSCPSTGISVASNLNCPSTHPLNAKRTDCTTSTVTYCKSPGSENVPAKQYVKFTCAQCVYSKESDGVSDWRCYENRQIVDANATLGENECGQIDILSGDSDATYCGMSAYNCNLDRCKGSTPTPTPTPTPTVTPTPTPPVGPACWVITMSKPAPKLNDSVNFTCGIAAGVHHYEFRIKLPNGTIQPLTAVNGSSQASVLNVSENITITQTGEYKAQCRVCTGADSSTCQTYRAL